MLSDPVAEAFGLIHRHPSGENFFRVCADREIFIVGFAACLTCGHKLGGSIPCQAKIIVHLLNLSTSSCLRSNNLVASFLLIRRANF